MCGGEEVGAEAGEVGATEGGEGRLVRRRLGRGRVWRRMVRRGTDSGEVGAAEAGEGKGAAEDGERAVSGKMSWAAQDNDARNDVSLE